eukprot:9495960-Pyramimonas_sp.AAC.1
MGTPPKAAMAKPACALGSNSAPPPHGSSPLRGLHRRDQWQGPHAFSAHFGVPLTPFVAP